MGSRLHKWQPVYLGVFDAVEIPKKTGCPGDALGGHFEALWLNQCRFTVKQGLPSNFIYRIEEDNDGFLSKSKSGRFETRQECPPVFAYNRSMYLIRVSSIKNAGISGLKKIRKVIMPDSRSVDIDDMKDWIIAEYFLTNASK